jgi:hypothetical protein
MSSHNGSRDQLGERIVRANRPTTPRAFVAIVPVFTALFTPRPSRLRARTITRTTVEDTGISPPFFDTLKNLEDQTKRLVARRVWSIHAHGKPTARRYDRVEHQRARGFDRTGEVAEP